MPDTELPNEEVSPPPQEALPAPLPAASPELPPEGVVDVTPGAPPPVDTIPTLPASGFSVLSAQQMRFAEQHAVQAGTPLIILMERAGLAVAEQIMARYEKRPTLVLCGPGNNGGDGFVTARHLSAKGWPVRVLLYGKLEELPPEAKIAASRWRGAVMTASAASVESVIEKGAKLVVDALYGIGLKRPIGGEGAAMLQAVNRANLPVVSIDIPSGLNSDTGQIFGQTVAANLTVCFFRKKLAHVLMPGRMICGETVVVDIGIPDDALHSLTLQVSENNPDLWSTYFPQPRLNMNKYDRGHALVLGGHDMMGAAKLAALAAQRMGAGLVTIAAPQSIYALYAMAMTSVMVKPVEEGEGFSQSFADILSDRRFNVAILGPGAGAHAGTKAAVFAALAAGKRCVIDADAINAFTREADVLRTAMEPLHGQCVITPHEGEFERLFQRVVDPTKDKISRVRTAAAYLNCPVLLKGADTVIASPEGLVIVNSNGPATLATAGTGDVLAGFIGGLMAQGVDAFIAACMGSWLHGAVATEHGPCLIAEDLINELPQALKPKASGPFRA
jgi:NAD(P)H-hydrate epimerase